MANKIYTTLANLYNEIKSARKDKASLGDAIDDSIKNQQEVLAAREGFPDLKTRLTNMEAKLSNTDVKYELLKTDFYNLDLTPPKAEVPVVSLDGKDFLVSLENKIAYREDFLTIPPNEQRIVAASGDNNMYDAYMRTSNTSTALKTYDFNAEDDVLYDTQVNILANKKITPKPTGLLYKIPFNISKIFSMDQLDAVILPNICSVTCDYSTPVTNTDGTPNYSNHMINILRGNGDWVVNRSYLTVMNVFDRLTPIARLVARQKSNSSICNVVIETSTDNVSWNRVYNGNESTIDITLPQEVDTKYIRYTYNCYDNSKSNYTFTLSEISIFVTEYEDLSEVVETLKPIPMYEHDTALKVITTGATDDDNHIITKFAISNTTDNNGKWSTYIPKSYVIKPKDFFDDEGVRYTGNTLKNNYKVDYVNTVSLETKASKDYTLTTLANGYGNIVLYAGNDIAVSSAVKVNDAAFLKAYLKINGTEYNFPIDTANINKEIKVVVGGYNIVYQMSILNNNVMKIFVRSDNVDEIIKIDEARVQLVGAEWFGTRYFSGGWSNIPMWNSSYSTYSRNARTIQGLEVEAYDLLGQYYTYTRDWFFGYTYVNENIPYSASAAIIPKKYKTSHFMASTSTGSIGSERNVNLSDYKNVNCELPLNIYLCNTTSDVLLNAITTDTIEVMRNDREPVFTYKKEFVTRVFVGKSGRVSKILSNEYKTSNDEIRYAVSYDNLNYYIFDKDALEWKTHFDVGMTTEDMAYPNETFFDQIKNSEWLFVKVIINSPNAYVNNITVQFVEDLFVLIDKSEILEKGIFKRHLEAIEPQSLTNFLRDDYSILKVASVAKTITPIYKYNLSGYQIQNYNDVQWERIDLAKIKEYLLPNNNLVYKNVTTATQYLKVVRRIIENQVAVINTKDEDRLKIDEIVSKETVLEDDIRILQQNVTLLHDSMLTGSVPTTLPEVMLPSIKEIDVPLLQEGEFYKVTDVPELRGIQVWEEQSSFVPYDEVLLFDEEHKSKYTTLGVVVSNAGAVVNSDYDRDNAYMLSEAGTKNSSTKVTYPNFDMTISVPPTRTDITAIIDNGGDPYWASTIHWDTDDWFGFGFGFRSTKYSSTEGNNVMWNLPGENIRMVDMIFDFRHNVWLNYLNDTDFGIDSVFANNWAYDSNQITTFSYSLDGREYIDVKKYTGYAQDQTIVFEKEIRFLRVRLELPYSINRGAGRVSFTEMNIWTSPVRYNHTGEFYIYNTDPIDTSQWLNFNQIKVDRFIDHNPAEMKFLLSDDPNKNTWKCWDGTKWVSTSTISLATAMSIETLLALTTTQLNLLAKGSLTIAAIMKTTDGYKTPVLRKVEFLHDLDTEKFYRMVDLNTIDFKYSKTKQEITITNDTDGDKKLKIVLL